MSLNTGTNVRLPPELRARLETIARVSGLKVADLIRMATDDYCAQVERSGRISISIVNEHVGSGSTINQTFSPSSSVPSSPKVGAKYPKPKRGKKGSK